MTKKINNGINKTKEERRNKKMQKTKNDVSIGAVHTHTHTNSLRKEKGITLIALVITIALNCSVRPKRLYNLMGGNPI